MGCDMEITVQARGVAGAWTTQPANTVGLVRGDSPEEWGNDPCERCYAFYARLAGARASQLPPGLEPLFEGRGLPDDLMAGRTRT